MITRWLRDVTGLRPAMIRPPSSPDFPRLAFDGSIWAAGDPDLVIENASIVADAIQPQWLHHHVRGLHARFGRRADVRRRAVHRQGGAPRLRAAGGNVVTAANGKWVIERDDPPRLIFDDGGEWPGYSSPALSDDGTLLACLTQADHTLLAGPPSGMRIIDGAGCLNPRWGSATLCWEKGTGLIYGRTTINQPTVALVVPNSRTFKPVPVWTGSALFVLTHTDDRVLARRMGLAGGEDAARVGDCRTGLQRRLRVSARRTPAQSQRDPRRLRRQRPDPRRRRERARQSAADSGLTADVERGAAAA